MLYAALMTLPLLQLWDCFEVHECVCTSIAVACKACNSTVLAWAGVDYISGVALAPWVKI